MLYNILHFMLSYERHFLITKFWKCSVHTYIGLFSQHIKKNEYLTYLWWVGKNEYKMPTDLCI